MELSIKTTSGKEFVVDHCVATNFGVQGVLYIEFVGYTMAELFPVFSDANETKTIYGYAGGTLEKTFENYTTLAEIFLVPETYGNVRIRLDRGVKENENQAEAGN